MTTRSNGATRYESARRRKLPRLRGVDWIDSFRGDASTLAGTARVRVETDRWARVRLDLLGGRDASAALEDNALLPTNVRFSGSPQSRCLLADAWLGDPLSGRGLREAIDAIQLAASTSSRTPIRRGGSKDRFTDAIAWLGEDVGVDVAELDTGWELTQRLRGRRVAIRAEPEKAALRLYRSLLSSPAPPPAGQAIADLAIRLNERTRLARFAMSKEGLVVEARFKASSIDPISLMESVCAISVAAVHARPLVRILTGAAHIARRYARTFDLPEGG